MENPFKDYKFDVQYRPAPHQIAATVNEILKVVGDHPKYGRSYWSGKVKKSKVSYTEIIGILKGIQNMDSKYNKGGRLTNLLSPKKWPKQSNALNVAKSE